MKNTLTPESKLVSLKTEKELVKPARVSDMGMGIRATKEIEKKQLASSTL